MSICEQARKEKGKERKDMSHLSYNLCYNGGTKCIYEPTPQTRLTMCILSVNYYLLDMDSSDLNFYLMSPPYPEEKSFSK